MFIKSLRTHWHSERVRKGFGMLYVYLVCSKDIFGVFEKNTKHTAWKCTSSLENVPKEFWNPKRILEAIRKHSSCPRNIPGVFGKHMYRSQCLIILIPNAPRTRHMLPERFSYMPDIHRMLPELFPNTHVRHIRMVNENYLEHAQNNFKATECRAEQPCSVLLEHPEGFPNLIFSLSEHPQSYSESNLRSCRCALANISSYRMSSRTPSLLIEHTECFPNILRLLSEHSNLYSERNGMTFGPMWSRYNK